jgi:DNA mismatch endonuclease (patch repair protein)
MSDIFSKAKRSEIMSRIRGKNTKPEILFRKALSAEAYPKGFRYRIHYKKIVGSPDVVFVKKKIAIFIDGDFWHGRNYGKKNGPKLRKKFWRDKIETNIRRDRKVNRQLKKEGWTVIRIWSSDVRMGFVPHMKVIFDILYK